MVDSSAVPERSKQEQEAPTAEVFLKAFPLKDKREIDRVKDDVKNNTIVILKITPLARKNVEELKDAVEQLTVFATSLGGDIARLGEERIIITPPRVRIWRGERAVDT